MRRQRRLRDFGSRNADRGEWLKDKFGMPWQIVPGKLWDWFNDPAKVKRVTAEVWQMKKLDLATLERAARPAG